MSCHVLTSFGILFSDYILEASKEEELKKKYLGLLGENMEIHVSLNFY